MTTPRIGLEKPDYRETRWDIPLNQNWDLLDELHGMVMANDPVITATAVDVFVYNTSKDSDGGAWRFKCNDKSWYNETLNTATRGATREFPAVALIVAESSKVTIYDATVAGCPMWMVFERGSTSLETYMWRGLNGGLALAVFALNGIISLGTGGSGIYNFNFVSDIAVTKYVILNYSGIREYIANRNTNGLYSVNDVPIVSATVNDVTMTVLPDAPIDALTGLPVPTIAVATDMGVSIIDGPTGVGTVVDIASSGGNTAKKICLDGDRLAIREYNDKNLITLSLPSVDYNYSVGSSDIVYNEATIPAPFTSNSYSGLLSQDVVSVGSGTFSLCRQETSGSSGISILKEDLTTPANGSVAYVTKDYNTGWLKGDIRRALICEAGGTTETLTATTIADRSVKASSLTVNGSLTRSPVATGAELQAISGFSVSNYLSQAYSADLDFGTGDFYICGWLKQNPNSTNEYILIRGYSTGGLQNGSVIGIYINTSGQVALWISDDSATSLDSKTSTSVVDNGSWIFITAQRNGSYLQLFKDGVKEGIDTLIVNALLSLNNVNANLQLGLSNTGLLPLTNGSLALWRMGAGSLTDAQIAEIYRTELPMFQANAKCTLQGSTNVVNSLAYDDYNDILHVATTSGVTEFKDLIVMDSGREQTADTKAISADSNYILSALATTVIPNIPLMNIRENIEYLKNKPFPNIFGDTTIEADGTIICSGEASCWEDENLDPTMLAGAGNLPTSTAFSTTGLHIAGFSGIQTDEVEGIREFPHKAKLNEYGETSVFMQFHCHAYPVDAVGGNVRLGLEYFFAKEGVAVSGSTTIYVTAAIGTTAWAKKTIAFPDTIPVPDSLGSQFHFRFFRLGADALDTYAGVIGISTIGFHYEIDMLGSHEMTVK